MARLLDSVRWWSELLLSRRLWSRLHTPGLQELSWGKPAWRRNMEERKSRCATRLVDILWTCRIGACCSPPARFDRLAANSQWSGKPEGCSSQLKLKIGFQGRCKGCTNWVPAQDLWRHPILARHFQLHWWWAHHVWAGWPCPPSFAFGACPPLPILLLPPEVRFGHMFAMYPRLCCRSGTRRMLHRRTPRPQDYWSHQLQGGVEAQTCSCEAPSRRVVARLSRDGREILDYGVTLPVIENRVAICEYKELIVG